VAVGRRSAADRNEHVDQTEPAFRIISNEQDRIRIANQPDMRTVGISFGPHEPECPRRIVLTPSAIGQWKALYNGKSVDVTRAIPFATTFIDLNCRMEMWVRGPFDYRHN